MTDLENYYERKPPHQECATSGRFPRNHVKFSSLLKPAEWIDRICALFGSRAFKLKDAILNELDSAAPLDECLGTKAELEQVREIVVSCVEGFDNNPFISSIGRCLTKKMALDCVRNRRRVLEFYHENKEFIEANGKFRAPVIITGMNRTGTTLLQRLMSVDPNTRSPYTFELELPIPPLTSEANPMNDPRIKKSGTAIVTMTKLARGFMEKFAESHLWSPTELEESFIYLASHNGVTQTMSALAGSAYMDDFCEEGYKRPLFRYERMFYTMLDAYRPAKSHWTLKSPSIAPYFPTIFEEYPDVRLIVTHRNPLIVLPSYCRMWESFNIPFDIDGTFDKHRFGSLHKKYVDKCLMVPLHYREAHPERERQIFDCIYDELFEDPIAMVRTIYRKYDLEYTKEFEDKMLAYLRENQQGRYGRHRYCLEEYGFDADTLYQEYREYMEHYGFVVPERVERKASFDWSHLLKE